MKLLTVLFCLLGAFASADEPSFREFERKPYVISSAEVAKIKEEIRTQCRLPKAEEISYPWYYHYEVGIAMQKKQDWQRALDSFIAALDHRDHPSRGSRIYGMWFVDYFPYYNIGIAHYHLGNWKCAVDSFRLSQMLENFPADSVQSYRLREMGVLAEHQLEK